MADDSKDLVSSVMANGNIDDDDSVFVKKGKAKSKRSRVMELPGKRVVASAHDPDLLPLLSLCYGVCA